MVSEGISVNLACQKDLVTSTDQSKITTKAFLAEWRQMVWIYEGKHCINGDYIKTASMHTD